MIENPSSRAPMDRLIAVASFLMGLFSLFCGVLALAAGLPAVLAGIAALWRVRRRPRVLGVRGLAVAGIALAVVPTAVSSCAVHRPTIPEDKAAAPCLRVLTLNLMQKSPVASREDRFAKIAEFLRARCDEGRPVDVLLLQEGCSGLWVGTADSINDLRRSLARVGLTYDIHSQPSFGVSSFLVFRVGVLTRAQIRYCDGRALDCRTGNWYDDCPIPGRKRVVMVGIDHAIGRVNLFSAHLASGGTEKDRTRHAEELLRFISEMDEKRPADVTVLGGDMNTCAGSPLYGLIAAHLTDAYAKANPGSAGPTFDLPGNPHNLGNGAAPRRIDFIFVKGKDLLVQDSEVVFGCEGWWVSDHAGVLTTLRENR